MGRCPRCGKGALFAGVLKVASACQQCGLSFAQQDAGDGPAFFALVIVGFLAVGLAAWVEIAWSPSLWIHALLWIPFTLIGSILCMRVCKAWLIALQFAHAPESFT